MDRTVIRAARPADAAQIALVHVRSWQGAYRGLLPQAYLDGLDPAQRVGLWERVLAGAGAGPGAGRAGVMVADAQGTLLGFASFSPSRDDGADRDRVGEITAIYLLPDAWGKGIGGRLIDAALGCMTRAGFGEATLWVLDANARARRFYEAGGWFADGAALLDESRGFPITEVRYRRSLVSPAL